MRAPFNTTCDLIYGPNGIIPGTVYDSGPCRLVPEKFEIPQQQPLSQRTSYLTLDFAEPNGPDTSLSGTTWAADYSYADRIAVPSGSSPRFTVLFVEVVEAGSGVSYYRAHLQGPPPPPGSVSGCFGCLCSPAQWRVTWNPGSYDPVFASGFFLLNYSAGSSPACNWFYSVPGVFLVDFDYVIAADHNLTVLNSISGQFAHYELATPWSCLGVNVMNMVTGALSAPSRITVTAV